MDILVIGGGGREHALAWKLRQSPKAGKIYVAPGNGGTALAGQFENLPITDVQALRAWAQEHKIGLTVVGPEAPLAAGVVDEFRAHGLRIFGPTRAAAQLESSKAFSKAFMRRHGIPTADYDTFTEPAPAHAFIERLGAPIVVKADGLAAGKGVVVAQTLAEAHAAVDYMLIDNKYGVQHNADAEGKAQPRVVIEEFLPGEEASFIVLCDGKNVLALATSQDHKRLLDGDQGPNTGGMGAYSPAPVVTADVHARAMREIILPTVRGMAKDGIPYTGFLYAGLMIDAQGRPTGERRIPDAFLVELFGPRVPEVLTQGVADPDMMPINKARSDNIDGFYQFRRTLVWADLKADVRIKVGHRTGGITPLVYDMTANRVALDSTNEEGSTCVPSTSSLGMPGAVCMGSDGANDQS